MSSYFVASRAAWDGGLASSALWLSGQRNASEGRAEDWEDSEKYPHKSHWLNSYLSSSIISRTSCPTHRAGNIRVSKGRNSHGVPWLRQREIQEESGWHENSPEATEKQLLCL